MNRREFFKGLMAASALAAMGPVVVKAVEPYAPALDYGLITDIIRKEYIPRLVDNIYSDSPLLEMLKSREYRVHTVRLNKDQIKERWPNVMWCSDDLVKMWARHEKE